MKNQKGITLIALVITIIVLIILAAVSIAMLTGDSGILTNATRAKTETNDGSYADKINMELNAIKADLLSNGTVSIDTITQAKSSLGTEYKIFAKKGTANATEITATSQSDLNTALTPASNEEVSIIIVHGTAENDTPKGSISLDGSSSPRYEITKAVYK